MYVRLYDTLALALVGGVKEERRRRSRGSNASEITKLLQMGGGWVVDGWGDVGGRRSTVYIHRGAMEREGRASTVVASSGRRIGSGGGEDPSVSDIDRLIEGRAASQQPWPQSCLG